MIARRLRTPAHVRIDPALSIDADPPLPMSAVTNQLHNAINTPSGGHVVLRARGDDGRLLIEIEDHCGGSPANKGDLIDVPLTAEKLDLWQPSL